MNIFEPIILMLVIVLIVRQTRLMQLTRDLTNQQQLISKHLGLTLFQTADHLLDYYQIPFNVAKKAKRHLAAGEWNEAQSTLKERTSLSPMDIETIIDMSKKFDS